VSAKLVLTGIDGLKTELQQLPGALAVYAQVKALSWAREAAREIRRRYPTGGQGRLQAGLQVVSTGRAAKAGATVVQNAQPRGNYFEYGTKKIRRTKSGARRGRMPATPLFRSTLPRMRQLYRNEVLAHMAAQGLTVTGGE
jgi:hypothetical protein